MQRAKRPKPKSTYFAAGYNVGRRISRKRKLLPRIGRIIIRTKSIEWLTEDQAFSPSYVSKLSLFFLDFLCVSPAEITDGGRGGRGCGDGEKAWSSINRSLLSG